MKTIEQASDLTTADERKDAAHDIFMGGMGLYGLIMTSTEDVEDRKAQSAVVTSSVAKLFESEGFEVVNELILETVMLLNYSTIIRAKNKTNEDFDRILEDNFDTMVWGKVIK